MMAIEPPEIIKIIFILSSPFIGSFLGLVVDRLPQNETIIWSRSRCRQCGVLISPLRLMPFLGWFMSKGRCASCDCSLPISLLIVELLALTGALCCAMVLDGYGFIAGCVLTWSLIPLAWIDWRHMLLPNSIVAIVLVSGVIHAAIAPYQGGPVLRDALIGVVVGGSGFLFIRTAYYMITGREGLGLGDVKLMAAAGVWVGWSGLPVVALVGALLALCGEIARSLITGAALTRHSQAPFGSYLCVALWVVWILQNVMAGWSGG